MLFRRLSQFQPIFDFVHTANACHQRVSPTALVRATHLAAQREYARIELLHVDATASEDAITPDRVENPIFELRASASLPDILYEAATLPRSQEAAHYRAERNHTDD